MTCAHRMASRTNSRVEKARRKVTSTVAGIHLRLIVDREDDFGDTSSFESLEIMTGDTRYETDRGLSA